MRIGVSLTSGHAVSDPREGARRIIERARAAEAAELDSLSLGDHHNTPAPYWQNTPMLGRLLAEWGPRPVGCLFLLPLWHPVLVAEHIGTLASLTDAPFIIQTGIGHGEGQFAAMSADHGTRGRTLVESVRVVKAILAGEPVESPLVDGPVEVALRPAQPVEWWIGGGPATVAIERAARIGDAWYASPALTPESAPPQLDVYLAACENEGVTARPIVRKDVIVAAEPGRARAAADELLAAGYRGLTADQVVAGTPTEVAELLRPFAEMGFTDVICRAMAVPQPLAVETMEQLGEVRRLLS